MGQVVEDLERMGNGSDKSTFYLPGMVMIYIITSKTQEVATVGAL